MRRRAAARTAVAVATALALCATIASAAERRYATDDEAQLWRGVGALRIGGGSCTGTLIRPDAVLTAAHCVADAATRRMRRPEEVLFLAGLKDGRYIEQREAANVRIHPAYFATGRNYVEKQIRVDVALVTLKRPITSVPAYPVAATPPVGSDVILTSYSRGRMERLSVQEPCRIIGRETEFAEFTCTADPGSSGAPVFARSAGGALSIIALNTGERVKRGTAIGLSLNHMRDFIGSTGAEPEAPSPGGEAGGEAQPAAGSTLMPGGSRPGDGLKRFRQ